MKKKDFARELSKLTGETISKSELFLDHIHDVILQEVAAKGECILPRVGRFKLWDQKPKIRTLPDLTKRATPGRKRVKFVLSRKLEEIIVSRYSRPF